MAINLDEQDGQTPLDPDERAGLLPVHLMTQGDLNDWEQENILRAVQWARRQRKADVLSEAFCRNLHKKMFDATWSWAGTFRKSDKNIGCDWTQISVKLRNLFDNTQWWVENDTFLPDEIAARFHRDLVWIHPFPNGNGRHARMMADALLRSLKQAPFSWGSGGTLVKANNARAAYLTALRAADKGDYGLLVAFARSSA
ncbi:mobile mystery protein B [Paraburkholderia sp. Ac-20340]|uniref:mobile mystery protein B n=1 Tax=Paraburkholderia sp. Ac-20340 TaxID=2703888 RepID=UPI001981CBBF|nr:mobile mystery protein B [Paraburkholderia sp. Ac-20340]MBN3855730.1 mobile mystery protein B [Paraburkholderia sp. Ac-20340]